MRLSIQGLRCLAVSAVVLFHLWPRHFENGFLGVDVFFVISGYLMCMLLSKQPLTFTTAANFYFRRLKRIVPLYLFVLTLIVFAATVLMACTELGAVIDQALHASVFISNMVDLPVTGYFGPSIVYPLFLHTWSLSVELQFYLVVPLIFFCLEKARRLHSKGDIVLISVLAIVSIGIQWAFELSEGQTLQNCAHMSFYCRIWQFMAGFLAFKAYSAYSTAAKDLGTASLKNREGPRYFTQGVFCFLLIVQLLNEILPDKQLNRLLVTATAALLMATTGDFWLLNSPTAVKIGDISYSIYLLHWPMIKLFQYVFYEEMKPTDELPFVCSVQLLIVMCLVVSYLIEEAFRNLLTRITTWRQLITVLALSYLALLLVTQRAYRSSSRAEAESIYQFKGQNLEDLVVDLYRNRFGEFNYTKNQFMELNNQMNDYGRMAWKVCQDSRNFLPSSKPYDVQAIKWLCHQQGNGTKEIVIIGNSLARDLFFGVKHLFKHHYANLTIIAYGHCTPYMTHALRTTSTCDAKCLSACPVFEENIIDLLRQWHRPIDIIISHHSYLELQNISYEENDEFQRAMNNFYKRLDEIAREAVFIPHGELMAPYGLQLNLKKQSQEIDVTFLEARSSNMLRHVNRRVENVKCEKCLKPRYEDMVCDKAGMCHVFYKREILVFIDRLHTTMFGNLFYADRILDMYASSMKRRARKINAEKKT